MLASIIMQKIKKFIVAFLRKCKKKDFWHSIHGIRFFFKILAVSLFHWPEMSCKILQRSDDGKLQNFDGQMDRRTHRQRHRWCQLHRTLFQLGGSNNGNSKKIWVSFLHETFKPISPRTKILQLFQQGLGHRVAVSSTPLVKSLYFQKYASYRNENWPEFVKYIIMKSKKDSLLYHRVTYDTKLCAPPPYEVVLKQNKVDFGMKKDA